MTLKVFIVLLFIFGINSVEDDTTWNSKRRAQEPIFCDGKEVESFFEKPPDQKVVTKWCIALEGGYTKVKTTIDEEVEEPIILTYISTAEKPIIGNFLIPSTQPNTFKLEIAKVEEKIWSLNLLSKQDYESENKLFYFSIEAESKTQYVEVTIKNIDDNPPKIQAYDNSGCSINENSTGVGPSKCIYKITDDDGDDYIETIQTSIIDASSKDVEQKFSILSEVKGNVNNKYIDVTINVKEELDFEVISLYYFTLNPVDSAKNSVKLPIIVQVNDIADTPPKWTSIFSTLSFDEETYLTKQVSARDGDLKINAPIKYSIKPDKFEEEELNGKIKIDPVTGVIDVQPIDRDVLKNDIVTFKIIAKEDKEPEMETDADVTFIIKDKNDNRPEIEKEFYDISMPETTSMILEEKIIVNDIDQGENSRSELKLVDKISKILQTRKFNEAFNVIPNMGFQKWEASISVKDPVLLDYEDPEWRQFSLEIVANDSEGEGKRSVLHINLENRNDEIPKFEKANYIFRVPENITKDKEVGKVFAEDKDVDDHVEYSLVGSSMVNALAIDKMTGVITTLKDNAFDYEKIHEVFIQVQAKDTLETKYKDPLHTAIASVTIEVTDVNDTPPTIHIAGELRVKENLTEEESHITTNENLVTAEDPDTDADLNFSIDWDGTSATKQGSKVDEIYYKGCIEIRTIHIKEQTSVYAELYVKNITLNEETRNLDYEEFEYLYLKIVVTDHNTVSGKKTDAGTLTIQIDDINDNPPIFNLETIEAKKSVTETSSTKQKLIIGLIAATDRDGPGNNNITYTLKPLDDTPPDIVEINPTTGQLYVDKGKAIDADTPPRESYTYDVTATDGKYEDVKNITVEIIDTNNKIPELNTSVQIQTNIPLLENLTESDILQRICAFDRDRDEPYHTIAYFINEGKDAELPELFSIDIHTGDFKLDCQDKKKCLDRDGSNGYDGHDKYTVYILLRDNNGIGISNYFDKINFTVLIEDVNDNKPILQDSTLDTRPEDTKKGTRIGTVKAIDIDDPKLPNSEVNFEVLNVYRKDEFGDITKVDKVLEAVKSDRDTADLYTLDILRGYHGQLLIEIGAEDLGHPKQVGDPKNYTFEVTKFNFEAPTFSFPDPNNPIIVLQKQQSNLNKLRDVNGNYLPKINATDNQGEKYSIRFEIIEEEPADGTKNDNNNLFKIGNAEAGSLADLQLTRFREDEDPRRYKVKIKGTHDGEGTGANTVEITVEIQFIDKNEEPFFDYDNYVDAEMSENSTTESFKIKSATDLKNEPIFYYLYESDETVFKVEKTNGTLGLIQPLDREEEGGDFKNVIIRASSSSEGISGNVQDKKSLLHINITVLDINDNPPSFSQDEYTYGLSEKDPVNREIIVLNATDPDTTDEGKLKFKMLNDVFVSDSSLESVKNEAFKCTENGKILNTFVPTDGMKGYFKFTVEVEDSPPQKYTSHATVKVSIISEASRVVFEFGNPKKTIEDNKITIEKVFSDVFGYSCFVDDISEATDESGVAIPDKTKVKTHFMLNNINTVEKDKIIKKAQDPDNIVQLRIKFKEFDLNFTDVPRESNPEDNSFEILKIILIACVVILALLCILLLVGCIVKVRSLNRRLDSMNVPIFGSTQSGLNRIGGGISAPGTNKHAIEANPVWNTDLKGPQFDNVSQGSGDSDLIGIEENANFETIERKASINPVLQQREAHRKSLNPLAAPKNLPDDIFT